MKVIWLLISFFKWQKLSTIILILSILLLNSSSDKPSFSNINLKFDVINCYKVIYTIWCGLFEHLSEIFINDDFYKIYKEIPLINIKFKFYIKL